MVCDARKMAENKYREIAQGHITEGFKVLLRNLSFAPVKKEISHWRFQCREMSCFTKRF